VTVFDESLWLNSYSLAATLREAGLKITTYPEPAKLPKQFKYADRMGIKIVIVIGPDEAATDRVTVKNLKSGTQETVNRAEVVKVVSKILESV